MGTAWPEGGTGSQTGAWLMQRPAVPGLQGQPGRGRRRAGPLRALPQSATAAAQGRHARHWLGLGPMLRDLAVVGPPLKIDASMDS